MEDQTNPKKRAKIDIHNINSNWQQFWRKHQRPLPQEQETIAVRVKLFVAELDAMDVAA